MQENQNGINRGEGEEKLHTSAEKLNQTAQNAAAESPEQAVKADAAAAENSAQNAAENAPNGAQKTPEKPRQFYPYELQSTAKVWYNPCILRKYA